MVVYNAGVQSAFVVFLSIASVMSPGLFLSASSRCAPLHRPCSAMRYSYGLSLKRGIHSRFGFTRGTSKLSRLRRIRSRFRNSSQHAQPFEFAWRPRTHWSINSGSCVPRMGWRFEITTPQRMHLTRAVFVCVMSRLYQRVYTDVNPLIHIDKSIIHRVESST